MLTIRKLYSDSSVRHFYNIWDSFRQNVVSLYRIRSYKSALLEVL